MPGQWHSHLWTAMQSSAHSTVCICQGPIPRLTNILEGLIVLDSCSAGLCLLAC
jgi:hypothetical protein